MQKRVNHQILPIEVPSFAYMIVVVCTNIGYAYLLAKKSTKARTLMGRKRAEGKTA
jgi:hypothetical protein